MLNESEYKVSENQLQTEDRQNWSIHAFFGLPLPLFAGAGPLSFVAEGGRPLPRPLPEDFPPLLLFFSAKPLASESLLLSSSWALSLSSVSEESLDFFLLLAAFAAVFLLVCLVGGGSLLGSSTPSPAGLPS